MSVVSVKTGNAEIDSACGKGDIEFDENSYILWKTRFFEDFLHIAGGIYPGSFFRFMVVSNMVLTHGGFNLVDNPPFIYIIEEF